MSETALQTTKTEDSLKSFLNAKRESLTKAMPSSMGITADVFIQAALNKVAESADLQKCNPLSICLAVMQAATIGLRVDLKQAHLVPRGGKACLDIDWRGYVHLVMSSGIVEDCNAYVVRENDPFEYQLGTSPKIIHKPDKDPSKRGRIILAYAFANLTTGRTMIEVIDEDDQKKLKALSSSPAWNKWPEQMWRKCVLKRLLQRVPQGASNIASVINARLAQVTQDFIDETKTPSTQKHPVIDITAEDVEPEDGQNASAADPIADDPALKEFSLNGLSHGELLAIYEESIKDLPASAVTKSLKKAYGVDVPSALTDGQLKDEIMTEMAKKG